jgi:enoyl-CoA hydratase/carnithine racemase
MSEAQEAPHLLTEVQDKILIATLNRPEKLNALSAETMRLFDEAVLRFRDTQDLKVMMVRATGRYFSAGADLKQGSINPNKGYAESASGLRENHRLYLNGMQRIYDEMEHIEKPFVSAIHAPCVGGGLELSLSCDFRLAAKSASFAFPEGKFGTLPASNGVSRLTRICGTHWARYLIMANKPADADRALIMGLVHEVYPDEGFGEAALAFCHHLAAQNGEQMAAAKIAIELAADVGLAQARNVERMANASLMMNPSYKKGMEEYLKGVGGKK